MTRWFAPLASRRALYAAALAGIAFWLAGPSHFSVSHERPRDAVLESMRIPPAALATWTTGYSIQDGAVTHGPSQAAPQTASRVDELDLAQAYSNAEQLAQQTRNRVFKAKLEPNWFAGNTRFWYRNDLKDNTQEFMVVDAEKGTRARAFDHDKLAASLATATNTKLAGNRLPFKKIEFVEDGKAVRFKVDAKFWQCNLETYECKPAASGPEDEPATPAVQQEIEDVPAPEFPEQSPEEIAQKKGQAKGKGAKGLKGPVREAKSPDGHWLAFIKEFDLWLRDEQGKETQVTKDGAEGNSYAGINWSPDSLALVVFRSTPGDNKTVYLLESSPKDQLPAKLGERPYPRPGDKLASHEMFVVNTEGMTAQKVDMERIDFLKFGSNALPAIRWCPDKQHFTIERTDRGHQRFRVVEVDARNGKVRNLIDEKAATMVDHYTYFFINYLDASHEILYLSEMDGWKHLYLFDSKAGKLKNQVTRGEWVVRKVEKVDVAKRQIWFTASGKNPDQDPYLVHWYRINFDGSDLVALTSADGNHSVEFSPDSKYLIDTYSRVDLPAVHELHRVHDGSKICDLEKADISDLLATGYRLPEVFVAKGRDGKTDIWGIVTRPQKYDETKKYPVIEYIYAGPHSAHVPKTFAPYREMAALAELGFIVVQIDGMGTGNRSRAFHDVCWKNLADAGFPDRILWIKALARKYAYVDIDRVGIYGTSAGGQNACGAVLFHPEFYKVAVASCGCHDNRLDKLSWNEAWMGLMGPHYTAQSNVTNAHKLVGHLLLIVGELDTNVPPESTYRVVDALINAKKDFDLIVVPGMGHSNGGAHGNRRRLDFFVQHLRGVTPPNHNQPARANP